MNLPEAKRAAFRAALAKTGMAHKFSACTPAARMAIESAAYFLVDPKLQATQSPIPGHPPIVATFTLGDYAKVLQETQASYDAAIRAATGMDQIQPLPLRKP